MNQVDLVSSFHQGHCLDAFRMRRGMFSEFMPRMQETSV